jgi:AcrR family transcriptional regulator
MDVEGRTVAAALRLVANSSVEDALSLLTTEALRNEMMLDQLGPQPSARTIALAFPGQSGEIRFSRDRLVEAILAQTIDEMLVLAKIHADGYLQAVDTVSRGGGPEAFVSAINRDLRDNQPGGDEGIDGRERVFHLCLAMCDDNPGLARQLKRFMRRHAELYAEAEAALGRLFNRRLATGVTAEQLHLALNGYARGVQLHLRCGAAVDAERVAETIIRIYWAHTAPIAGTERTPVAELWSGVNHRSGSRTRTYSQ